MRTISKTASKATIMAPRVSQVSKNPLNETGSSEAVSRWRLAMVIAQAVAAICMWGTLVGVTVLAVGISGIQQLGADFYVEPLFNGVTLIASIGIAGYAQRKRIGSIERRLSAAKLAGPVKIDAAVAKTAEEAFTIIRRVRPSIVIRPEVICAVSEFVLRLRPSSYGTNSFLLALDRGARS